MSVHRPVVRLVVVVALACSALAVVVPAGFADTPVGATAKGTAIVADAGYAAWRADDGRVVVRAGDGAPRTTSLKPPASAILDVGIRAGGAGGQLVYVEGCSSRSGYCAVRSATLTSATVASGQLTARVIAHIPYRAGGGSPAVAVDGSRLAYVVHGTTGSGRGRSACDVPYLRTLSSRGGSSSRKLDRGHCAAITQLDVGEGYVAILAHPAVTYGSGATEARVVKLGGGPSRTLQREAQGEESNYIGALSLDRRALYTARGGIRQANVFTRIELGSRARAEARAFVNLQGAFARDRGRNYYAQTVSYESATECGPGADAPGCLVVAGSDPFAGGQRVLAPELSLTVAPQPVYVDSAPAAVATLTRRTVTRNAVVSTAPVAGVPVELLSSEVVSGPVNPGPLVPTGARATTGADGVATIAIPGTPRWRLLLGVVTRPGDVGGVAIPTSQTTNITTYVHMTANAARLPDDRLRVTGTISPAQPGRKVRLDRKLERICNQRVGSPRISPSSVGVPAGCFDRWTQDPITTATVSADGASYTLDATAPAGTYRVSLDFAGGAAVYAGETAAVDTP